MEITNPKLLKNLHKMTPKKLFAWFNRATPEEIEAVTQKWRKI